MPLLSGPDEPTHVVKAAGVIRGQFVGKCNGGVGNPNDVCAKSSPFTEVRVPAFYSLIRNGGNIPGTKIPHHGVACFSKRINIPASCVIFPSPTKYKNLVENAWIYDGRYPPLYYVIVGIPSLFGSGQWALYLMRLFGAAACALFVSVAIFSILRYAKSRMLLVGVVVAATPMVLYLSAVVNSSGLEVASALAFWTTAILIARDSEGSPPLALLLMCALSSLAFISTRSLSPFWYALALLSVLSISRWRSIVKLLVRRDVQLLAAVILLVGIADVFWIVYEHSTVLNVSSGNAQALIPPPSTSELTILRTSFHHNIYYLPGMIAVLGSFDTYAPHLTFIIWYLLGALVLLAALVLGDMRARIVLVLVGLGILLLPVIISSSQARHIGYVWSGRDTLPFAVGLPVLGASVIGDRLGGRPMRLVVAAGLVLAWVAQGDALFGALRRYSVGDSGPRLSFLFHSPWAPPVFGVFGSFVIDLAVLGIAYLLVFRSLGPGSAAPEPLVSVPSHAGETARSHEVLVEAE